MGATLAAIVAISAQQPAIAQSSARRQQVAQTQDIPRCTRRLGTVAIGEPDRQWWYDYGLSNPEAILKVFVMRSGCFGLVDRGRGLAARGVERGLADSGELQRGSNIGRGQVRAADYTLIPDVVTGNRNSGGMNLGGLVGGLIGGRAGGLIGGLNVRKKEANVTLTLVNTRTTEQERLTEGFAKKQDLGFGGGGALFGGGVFGAGGSSYENTELGQVVVLAYLDAYTRLVQELGGLPLDPSRAAPRAN